MKQTEKPCTESTMTFSDNMTEQKRRKIVSLGIYGTKLEFILTQDIVAHYKALCNKYDYLVNEDYIKGKAFAGLHIQLDHHFILIHEDHLSYNTVTHELHHACRAINKSIGINDEEADANLCGYLNSEIFKFLNKEKYIITYGK